MVLLDPQVLIQEACLPASEGTWGLGSISAATDLLGWRGVLRGPINFRSTTFIAVHRDDISIGAPGSPWLVGCLVPGAEPRGAMQDASLLAGYSCRAILVKAPVDALDVRLQAALLDQGAVLDALDGLSVLSTPGEVVPSPLQQDGVWQEDHRWLALCEEITSAPRIGRNQ